MRLFPFLAIILLACFSLTSFTQSQARQDLLVEIEADCPKIFDNNCSEINFNQIADKFRAAELFLLSELKRMVLVDSSTYYNRKKKELQAFEASAKIDSIIDFEKYISDREHFYLLLSLSKPWTSDSLYFKLIKSYAGLKANPNKHVDSESIFYYKKWLYELLDSRFGEETKAFYDKGSKIFYNQIIESARVPFTDLESEKQLVEKLENWAKIATSTFNSSKADQFFSGVYSNRARQINASQIDQFNEKIFEYTEYLYLKAVKLDPNNKDLSYSFGVFYYNSAVKLGSLNETNISSEQRELNKVRIKALTDKAVPLLQY